MNVFMNRLGQPHRAQKLTCVRNTTAFSALPRTARVVVEHRALEVEGVPEILSQVPIQSDRPRVGLPAGTGAREAERERLFVDRQRVVARRDLHGPR